MDELGAVQKPLYPTTIWSEVQRAEDSTLALERLLKQYYRPLHAHLQFKFHVDEGQASDWLQEFIRQKVLLDAVLAKASKARGRFRTFLLNTMDNFVISELRRQNAQVRRPAGGHVSFDEFTSNELAEISASEGQQFDVEWARAVLAETVARMEAECQAKGRPDRWEVFKTRLLEPLFDGAAAPRYEELVSKLGFRSPAEASNALITAKRMFDRLLREVIAEYAGEGADLGAELRELKQALSGAR
jgi:RNA polymerase sigma-70 factor (ECF subfamily)